MMHRAERSPPPSVCPPLLWWASSALCWLGAVRCQSVSAASAEPVGSIAAAGCMFAAVMGGSMLLRALRAGDSRVDRRRLDRIRRASAQSHGGARFAHQRDLVEGGVAAPVSGPRHRARGIFLGHYREGRRRGVDICYKGENSTLTVAPPGAGKLVSGVLPNLFFNSDSIVCHDPRFEAWAVTAEFRRRVMGHEIVLLAPHAETTSKELGLELRPTGYSPLCIVRDGPTLKDDIELIAQLMLPNPGHRNPQAEFFAISGQRFLIAAGLDLKRRGGPFTLPAMHRWLMASPKAMEDQLADLMRSDGMNGLLSETGGKLLTTLANAPEEFQGGLSTCQNAVRSFDGFGPLGAHVSKDEFRPETMKDRGATVYVGVPTEFTTQLGWVNLVLCTMIEAIGRRRTHANRVTFLLDELANIGYMPNLLRAMSLYRAQGCRVQGYCQQISQLRRLYGAEGWRDIVGCCDVVQAFGTTEPETLNVLSGMLGTSSVEAASQHQRPGGHDGGVDLSLGQSWTGQPLARPEAIRMLPSGKQIIMIRNMPPILADKVDYRSRAWMRRAARPNPYYERPSREAK